MSARDGKVALGAVFVMLAVLVAVVALVEVTPATQMVEQEIPKERIVK